MHVRIAGGVGGGKRMRCRDIADASGGELAPDDKRFRIQKLRNGSGRPLIVANGFLTRGRDTSTKWLSLIDSRYPDSPVYRVHWDTQSLIGLLKEMGPAAGVAAMRNPYLAPVVVGASAVGAWEWWDAAQQWASSGGATLARVIQDGKRGMLCRCCPILLGHSLGGLLMLRTAAELGRRALPSLDSVHLLGVAAPTSANLWPARSAVRRRVFNYYSTRDTTLATWFRAATLGTEAAGRLGFGDDDRKVRNIDVSETVSKHSAYFTGVRLL